jgi:hypothetical protein
MIASIPWVTTAKYQEAKTVPPKVWVDPKMEAIPASLSRFQSWHLLEEIYYTLQTQNHCPKSQSRAHRQRYQGQWIGEQPVDFGSTDFVVDGV